MGHDHHHCECKHDRIKYCGKCKVPHCLDCGMEWVTKPAVGYWYYPNTYVTGGTGYIGNVSTTATYATTSGNAGGAISDITLAGSLADSKCQH